MVYDYRTLKGGDARHLAERDRSKILETVKNIFINLTSWRSK
jgi:hypothetical protein